MSSFTLLQYFPKSDKIKTVSGFWIGPVSVGRKLIELVICRLRCRRIQLPIPRQFPAAVSGGVLYGAVGPTDCSAV